VGYDVHITRAEEWTDSEKWPISREDWLAYVEQDPEMRLDCAAETTTTEGETLRYESAGLAVWTAYSGHGVNGNMAWFDYREGRVVVKNPDDQILGKMVEIARDLDANVQGDDGERYDDPGTIKTSTASPERVRSATPWWRRLLGGGGRSA
jgi:hypothetical protein